MEKKFKEGEMLLKHSSFFLFSFEVGGWWESSFGGFDFLLTYLEFNEQNCCSNEVGQQRVS